MWWSSAISLSPTRWKDRPNASRSPVDWYATNQRSGESCFMLAGLTAGITVQQLLFRRRRPVVRPSETPQDVDLEDTLQPRRVSAG